MSETVTLELPDTVIQSARAIAAQTQRCVEDILIDWLYQAAADVPVESLPDDQVLALRDTQMPEGEQVELSDLLARQRESTINDVERQQLATLMGTYRRGMVRKARALKVAVERGLQPPLI